MGPIRCPETSVTTNQHPLKSQDLIYTEAEAWNHACTVFICRVEENTHLSSRFSPSFPDCYGPAPPGQSPSDSTASLYCILPFLFPYGYSFSLKVEAVLSSETSLSTLKNIRFQKPEHHKHSTHRHDNLKTYKGLNAYSFTQIATLCPPYWIP